MTEQLPSRPAPGPPRPVPGPGPSQLPSPETAREDRFAHLEEQPVAEHVAVFEDEHARLQRELGTIDQV